MLYGAGMTTIGGYAPKFLAAETLLTLFCRAVRHEPQREGVVGSSFQGAGGSPKVGAGSFADSWSEIQHDEVDSWWPRYWNHLARERDSYV